MALDGVFIHSLVEEIKNNIIGGKIHKVNQPEKDEILLSIKNNRNSYKLLISASSVYPKIHFTDIIKENPIKPPMFCMVLRKYLSSAKIIDIKQLSTDRIIFIDFESSDEIGFNSIYTLVIEIMGRHSNITLIRQRDNLIMDSIKHITPEINSVRSLYPGIQFISPPSSRKLNAFYNKFEDFKNYILNNNIKLNETMFSSVFTGVSSSLSKEIFYRIQIQNVDFNLDNLEPIYNISKDLFNNIKCNKFEFNTYIKEDKVKDFYCIDFKSLSSLSKISYTSASKLLDEFYFKKDKLDRLNSKSSDLQKLININIERCTKKLKILEKNLTDAKSKDKFRIYGELLTANIYNIKQGMKNIKVLNYYNNEEVDISLDPNKGPSFNIQKYFKKYNKLKKTEEASKEQIKNTMDELTYLNSVFTNIKNAGNYDDIEDIKKELIETGYIKFKKKHNNKKNKNSKPMHFISSDGFDIYVGKNNLQNDYLTLKFSGKHDIWMHTKNIPGSHVIIKKISFEEIPKSTLEEAACLAAFYSKAKDSSKVEVDYTEIKNVHKPNGVKPGMVIYYTNKTILIAPKNPNLKEAK